MFTKTEQRILLDLYIREKKEDFLFWGDWSKKKDFKVNGSLFYNSIKDLVEDGLVERSLEKGWRLTIIGRIVGRKISEKKENGP